MYDVFKFLHIIGVVVLIGNVTVTAFWKVFADRSGETRVVVQAQRAVSVSEWLFTVPAIFLIVIGGYGMAGVAKLDLVAPWLLMGQGLLAISGGIWLVVLVPLQIRQARYTRGLGDGAPLDASYRADCRRWLMWGIVATVPLIAAVWIMIVRP